MAESAISLLFNKLSFLIQQEAKLLGGLEQEVEYIRDEIGHMRAFLRVADAKEESDDQLKVWVRQVREIAYDTEDVFEIYMLRFPNHYSDGFRGYLIKSYVSVKNLKARHQLATEIQAIRARVENASRSQQRYKDMYPIMHQGSSSTDDTKSHYDVRDDALFLEDTEVVGIEEPKEQLLEWINCADHGLKVISVVGMAGLGKTTLVKKVYDDTKMKKNFDYHLKLTVSESFKLQPLLKNLIKQLIREAQQSPPQGMEDMDANDMMEFILEFLKNKNYIIMLDDIWEIDAWNAIRNAFPRSGNTSRGRIIITTRSKDVGQDACRESDGHVYSLEPLSKHKSVELFNRKAFRGSPCPPYLQQYHASILKRCDGLPLPIVVIGGLLATKNDQIEEWKNFNSSMGLEQGEDKLNRMSKLLSLSFYDLPYYLKACFLYLSIFPEDHVIEKATVIRLWIAEGFVEPKQGKTREEIAEGYLNELFNRSLIQVAETNLDGRPRNFHIHDLLREYIISKSREQNMVVINNQTGVSWPDKIRCLAIHDSNSCTEKVHTFKYLRSLIFLGSTDYKCRPILDKVMQSRCRLLKVLDLRRAPLNTIPNEVFKLYHLEYLSLRDTEAEHIPKSIGNLQKLEILDLKRTGVSELPIEISKLQKLRILLVYKYIYGNDGYFVTVQSFKAPYEIGKLLFLQKLCYIDVGEEIKSIKLVREVGKLTRLQKLCITNLRREDGKDFCSSLAKLTNLRSLNVLAVEGVVLDLQYSLNLPFLRTLELNGRLEKLPQWIPYLSALTVLVLTNSKLKEDPLECLQGMPNLVYLALTCAYEGEGLCFKSGGFQKLKKLYLWNMDGLQWVTVEKESLPQLEEMTLWNCKSMMEVPVGIQHLSGLQVMEFWDMSEEFIESLYQKIEFFELHNLEFGEAQMPEGMSGRVFDLSKKY